MLASRETSERLPRDIGADLAELATHMADKLDRGMFEHWRGIQVASSLDTMRDTNVTMDAKSVVIERLRSTYPEYAAVAFMSPEGQVKAATIPQMVCANIAQRGFFVEGGKAPFVGDVHDAILLAKIRGNDPADPPRFVGRLHRCRRSTDPSRVSSAPVCIGPEPRNWNRRFEAPHASAILASRSSSWLVMARCFSALRIC